MAGRVFLFFCLFYGVLGTDLGNEKKLKQNQFDENHILSLARAKCTIDSIFDNKPMHPMMKQMKGPKVEKKQLLRDDTLTECVENDPTYKKSLHNILKYGTDLCSIKEALFVENQTYQHDTSSTISLYTSPYDLKGMLHLKAESIHKHNTAFENALKKSQTGLEQGNGSTKSDEERTVVEPEKIERKAFWRIRENICWFCRCEILPDQLRVETNYFVKSAKFPSPCHAICGAGFQGYECSYYPIGRKPNYTPFEWRLLEVFQRTNRFVDINSDFLKEELKLKTNEYTYKRSMKNINPDVAFWRDYNGQDWAIHRKWFGEPKDVKWEQLIVEILKKNIMVPTKYIEKIFKKENVEEKVRFSVPIRVIDFIQKYTQCASFEEAVKKYLPEVKFIDCNGERFMRLRLKTEAIPEETHRESFVSCDSTPKNPNHDFDSPEDALFENLPRHEIHSDSQKRDYCANQIEEDNTESEIPKPIQNEIQFRN